MKFKIKAGLGRIFRTSIHSVEGLVEAFKSEEAIRQEFILIVLLLPVAFIVDASAVERALLIFSLFWILIAELVNTAIETIVDRISEDYHLLSKRAKDIGSAAVFLSILATLSIWAIILVPKFL